MKEIKFSKKQLRIIKSFTKSDVRSVSSDPAPKSRFKRKPVEELPKKKFQRKQVLVKLYKLKPGNLFKMPFCGMTGKLLHVNECRAYVTMDQQIDINDPNVYKIAPEDVNISPGTLVIKTSDSEYIAPKKVRKKRKQNHEWVPRKTKFRRKTL
jgi:hypothetical protein